MFILRSGFREWSCGSIRLYLNCFGIVFEQKLIFLSSKIAGGMDHQEAV
jgi:hypothetical protein